MDRDDAQPRLGPALAINLGVRFALELYALAATAYWGYHAASGPARWLLAVAAPALVAGVWGLFVAPRARVAAPMVVRRAVEAAVFVAAGAGLVAAGEPALGVILVVAAAISGALNHRFAWSPAG